MRLVRWLAVVVVALVVAAWYFACVDRAVRAPALSLDAEASIGASAELDPERSTERSERRQRLSADETPPSPSTVAPGTTCVGFAASLVIDFVDERGALLANVTPEVFASNERGLLVQGRHRIQGSVCFEDLENGRWTIDVAIEDWIDARREVEIDASSRPQRLVVAPREMSGIEVRFDGVDGAPLRRNDPGLAGKLHVVASPTPLPRYVAGHACAPPERFGIGEWSASLPSERESDEAGDGILRFRAPPPVWVGALYGGAILASARVERGEEGLVLTVDRASNTSAAASISWRAVASESRLPLTDHSGTLTSFDGITAASVRVLGADGTLERVPPSTFVLRLEASGRAPRHFALDLAPGRHRDLGEVELERLGPESSLTYWGRVVRDGRGVVAYELQLVDLEAQSGRPPLVDAHVRSEQNGRFSFSGLEARTYAVRGTSAAFPPRVVDLRRGSIEDAELTLVEPARVLIRVPLNLAGPAWLAIDTAEGLPAHEAPLHGSKPFFLALAPGAYRVRRYAGVELVATKRFAVEPGGNALDVP